MKLNAASSRDERLHLHQAKLVEVQKAISCLQELDTQVSYKNLQEFHQGSKENKPDLNVRRGNAYLDSSEPFFWARCFTDVFFRGDCMERTRARHRKIACSLNNPASPTRDQPRCVIIG